MTKNTKPTRGRPTIAINFNFGKGKPFSIDQVLSRYKGKISRPGVYNKLMGPKGLVTLRKARIVDHNGPVVEGRSHPAYRFILNSQRGNAKRAEAAVAVA